jgi:hypothetical protein
MQERGSSVSKEAIAVVTIEDYFHEQVTEVARNKQIDLSIPIRRYTSDLLGQFSKSENLFQIEEGQRKLEPLALMLKDALEHTGQQRIMMFRRLGDVSLYVSGYFPDSLKKKLVDTDYYIDMGGKAYQSVAELAPEGERRRLFADLSVQFERLVEVLAEVADTAFSNTCDDVIDLYERWQKTGSAAIAQKLKAKGLVPVAAPVQGTKAS